jgi:TonB family protein
MRLRLVPNCVLYGTLAMMIGLCGAQQKTQLTDKDIRVISFEELTYPPAARAAHIQGVVVVRVKLDGHGDVAEAEPISGSEVLIPACIVNVKRWRFQPNPLNAAVIIYNFRMIDGVFKNGTSRFVLEGPNFATITSTLQRIEP